LALRIIICRLFPLFSLPLLLCSTSTALAGPPARVVAVHDGDTLTALVAQRQIRVRLIDIDAPELGQPYGARSKQSLSELCFGQDAELEVRSLDRYGRTLAQISCAGKDANAEQIRRGYAWTYTRYAPRNSPLHALEREARTARRGLWGDPAPVAPWEWRRNGRHASTEGVAALSRAP
jgi:endonuclease YncB( thermonuclease family)